MTPLDHWQCQIRQVLSLHNALGKQTRTAIAHWNNGCVYKQRYLKSSVNTAGLSCVNHNHINFFNKYLYLWRQHILKYLLKFNLDCFTPNVGWYEALDIKNKIIWLFQLYLLTWVLFYGSQSWCKECQTHQTHLSFS